MSQISSSSPSSRKSARVTQAEIAAKLGVDQTTVSACLSNTARTKKFSPQLREQILSMAQKMNYRPHFFATQLRSARPHMMVLAIGTLQDIHAGTIAEAFTQRAEKLGYRVVVSIFGQNRNGWEALRDIVGPQGIQDICLITRAAELIPNEQLQEFLDEGMRVTMISSGHPDRRVMEVRMNEDQAGRMAYEYLHRHGHRNIWLVTDENANPQGAGARTMASLAAARDLNAPEPFVIPFGASIDGEEAYLEISRIIKERGIPDAVLAVRDRRAYSVIRAFDAMGLRVGKDVSVMGHHDIWPSRIINPPLTTIRQPLQRMGSAAASLMVDSMNQESEQEKVVLQFQPELVERESVHRKP
ncbi:MAG: LacI family DNA-binding transcriptional regulator [Chthoniobacteraceae bacterium]